MACKCGSDRILSISAKCSDLCSASFGELEHDGYVPIIEGLGGGDYLDIEVCVECGSLQNFDPITDKQVKAAFKGDDYNDEDEDEDEALEETFDDDAYDPITGRLIKK